MVIVLDDEDADAIKTGDVVKVKITEPGVIGIAGPAFIEDSTGNSDLEQ